MMNETQLRKLLKPYEDQSYISYIQHTIPQCKEILGVRMSDLRKIAKQIIKEDPYSFTMRNPYPFYEDTILQALVAGLNQEELSMKEEMIRHVVSVSYHWCCIDTLVVALRQSKYPIDRLEALMHEYLHSTKEFEQRFGFVLALTFFAPKKPIAVLETIGPLDTHGYYSQMAKAWCLAECGAFAFEESYQTILSLDDEVVIKQALQKLRDSYRTKEKIYAIESKI